MFPDIPKCATLLFRNTLNCYRDNIRYDLLRTGSIETTTNKILERGFLEAVWSFHSWPIHSFINYSASKQLLYIVSERPQCKHIVSGCCSKAKTYSTTRVFDIPLQTS